MRNYTRAKLEPVIQRHNRTLTLDDVDAIVDLDLIAARIDKTSVAAQQFLSDYFRIGDRFFTSPTFARSALIERILEAYGEGPMSDVGVIYALDMNRSQGEIEGMPSRFTLLKYRMGLDIRLSELKRKFNDRLMDDSNEADDEASNPKDVWSMCCILAKEVGGSPQEWMNAPQSKIEAAVKVIDDMVAAQHRELSGRNVATAPVPTAIHYAVKEFADKLKSLEDSWLQA